MTNYRRRKRPQKVDTKQYSTNHYIRGDEFRVIDEEGHMIAVMSRAELFKTAQEKEMDVIEINPKANPPVVKLMDYNKFKYQLAKSQNNKPKAKEMKTVRVSVRVSDNDLAVKANKVIEFFEKDLKVKIQVLMRGRERSHPEVAEEVMHKFLNKVGEGFAYESEPKLVGASYFAIIK